MREAGLHDNDCHSAVAAEAAEYAARTSYGRLLAFLSARSGDIAAAEDALSSAFEAALESWPRNGVPDQPDAWLLTVARRTLIDIARHRKKHLDVHADIDTLADIGVEMDSDSSIPDRRLGLMFACAHPAIEAPIRSPLILQAILGFDAAAIASAFLIAPSTMSQRLVRAKQKIKLARIPLVIPEIDVLAERVEAVADAIYAAYAGGWSDPAGTEPHLLNLAGEALWLGRLLAALMPEQPETLGLLALMLYTEARRSARRGTAGEYIPLSEQDPASWNADLIEEAEQLLMRAAKTGIPGRYQLEAALQSAHVARRRNGNTDWHAIALLYEALYTMTGSPVVAINRAVALAETMGPASGLAQLELLSSDRQIREYQPYWAARADLLSRIGNKQDAAAAYGQAIGLESDPAVRQFLQAKLAKL